MLWHGIVLHFFFFYPINIPFCGHATFYLSLDGHLGCFHLIAIMDIHVQVFAWTWVFNSLGIYLGVELLGHIIILCLICWRTAKLFCKEVPPFYIFTNFVGRFQFLCMIAKHVIFFGLFEYSHSSKCEEVPPHGFTFLFPIWMWLISFSCLTAVARTSNIRLH